MNELEQQEYDRLKDLNGELMAVLRDVRLVLLAVRDLGNTRMVGIPTGDLIESIDAVLAKARGTS